MKGLKAGRRRRPSGGRTGSRDAALARLTGSRSTRSAGPWSPPWRSRSWRRSAASTRRAVVERRAEDPAGAQAASPSVPARGRAAPHPRAARRLDRASGSTSVRRSPMSARRCSTAGTSTTRRCSAPPWRTSARWSRYEPPVVDRVPLGRHRGHGGPGPGLGLVAASSRRSCCQPIIGPTPRLLLDAGPQHAPRAARRRRRRPRRSISGRRSPTVRTTSSRWTRCAGPARRSTIIGDRRPGGCRTRSVARARWSSVAWSWSQRRQVR